MFRQKLSAPWLLILSFAFIKLLIHFLTNTNYELHRDAFLYLAEADHLDFGFLSIPPLTPFLAKLSIVLFGDSVFAVRFLPALVGAISILIIAKIVLDLGGKYWALIIACLTYLISAAFLRSNTLLQPVSFDQFFWLLSTYFSLKLLQSKNSRYWIHLGITWGLAFLTKYSIVFLALGFMLALLIRPERKLIRSKYFLGGGLLGFMIILPNLIWQYNHNWPVLHHMAELHRHQLVNVTILSFLIMQFIMNMHGMVVWIFGLIFLLFFNEGKKLRVLGFTFLSVLLILILLRGKHYYTLGIYPILFAVGGFAIEKYWIKRLAIFRPLVIILMILTSVPVIPYSLPLLSLDKMASYAEFTKKIGFAEALRWEDGQIHPLPQDYADMTGWKELADIVYSTYHKLTDKEKKMTTIYAENYGQAGAIRYHTKKLGLPEPISFSDNFLLWAPDSLTKSSFIYVNDDSADISYFFKEISLVGSITDPYARESGLPVFICRNPQNGFFEFYRDKVQELKGRYKR